MQEAQIETGIRVPHRPMMEFYNRVKDIVSLYPKLRLIQDKIDEEKKIFSCTLTITEPLLLAQEEEIQGDILRLIQEIILPTLPQGFKSTLGNIAFVVQDNSKNETSAVCFEIDMATICKQVEQEFPRDNIHVAYDNGKIIVYGAAPYDHNRIRGEVIARIPHTMPCLIHFKSGAALEEDQNIAATIHRSHTAFTGVRVSGSPRFGVGLSLLWSQIGRTVGKKIFPE